MSGIPTHAKAIPFDEAGMIATDVPCIKCGYNLRGLDEGRVCPECGTAVGRSLRGDFLKFCDPDWVGTVASGLNWVMAGIAIGFVGGLITGVLTRQGVAPPALFQGFILLLSLVPLIGYWRLTAPDPAATPDQGITARRLVRVTQVLGFGLGFLTNTELLAGQEPAEELVGIVSGVNLVIFFFAVLIYLRRMALRIPNTKLASSCRTIMWGWVILALVGIGGAVVAETLGRGGGGGMGAGEAILCSTIIATPIFLILSLILALRLRRAFADEAKLARATWAAGIARPIAAM